MRISSRHLVIPGILVFFFIASSVNIAATKTTDLIFIRSDVGFSSACSYYEIKNYGLDELKEDKLKTLKLADNEELRNTGYVNGIKEVKGKIKNPVWEYEYTETYDCSYDSWVSKVTCEMVYDPVNKTDYESCTDNGHFEFIEKECTNVSWIPAKSDKLNKVKVPINGGSQVRFCADIEREFTEDGWTINVDHIPEFDGIEYKEYAWWSGSYSYRYHIDFTPSSVDCAPYPVNNTFGIQGEIYWALLCGDGNYTYSVGAGTTGEIAIADQANQVYWTNESNMTGNSSTSVYDANYEFVLNAHNTSMLDSTSNGVVFTKSGDPTQTSGVFGKGIDLDGAGDYYTFGSLGIFDGDFTIQFWVNFNAEERTIFMTWSDEKNMLLQYDYSSYPDRLDFFWYEGAAASHLVSTDTLALNAWHYVAIVVNNSNTNAFLYVNGTLQGSDLTVGSIDAASSDSYLGANVGGGLELDGQIDEYRVSSIGRSEIYISAMWAAGQNTLTALGAEETPTAILTTLSPDNITYTTTSITINASTSVSANVTWSEDGGANQTMRDGSTNFENITTLAEGTHYIFVYAVEETDDTNVDSNQTFFTIDMSVPIIIIEDPTGTNQTNATIPLNFDASDAYSSIDTCMYSLNNATNVTIAGCANITFAVTQAGTHNITVYANDTVGWESEDSSSFAYDPLQNFTANDSLSGEQISDFQVLIVETGVSGSTTNGTAPILSSAIGYGARTFRFIASGYNTTDFSVTFTNETLLTENYTLVPASMNITVLDEADAAIGVTTNITFNVTISNATQSNTWYNQSAFFKYTNSTPTGSVTIDISSYGYQPRRFYFTINENIANDFIAYLLKSTDALFVRFHILTVEGLGISGAEVSAQRFIGGAWVLIEEKTADDAGIAGLSLAPFASYKVTASATGYVTQVQSITPSASDYYFYMATTTNVSYHVLFEDITYYVTPQDPSIQTNVSYDMVFNITSSNSTLEWYSMNITYNETTAVFFLNVTGNADGGNITYQLNSSYASGNYTMEIKFKKTDYTEWTGQYYYQIRNFVTRVGSLWHFLQQFAASDAPPMFKHLVAIFTAFSSAGVASKMGMRGGGVLAGIVLIIWTGAGWFSWNIMLLTVLSVLAVYALKEGL